MTALRGIYFSGLLFLGVLTLTSCRFGNKVVNPPGTQNPDTLSGFYETDPQALKVCATHESTKCADINPGNVPDEIAVYMSNPLYFQVSDPSTGAAFIEDPFGVGYKLHIFVDAQGALSYIDWSAPAQLWEDPACTTRMYIEENGQLIPATSTRIVTISNYALKMAGRMDLRLQLIYTYEGECKASLQAMYNCYDDVNQCGASTDSANKSRHANVQSLFNYYIKQGVMEPQDILTLTNVAYDISYQ